MSTVSLQSRTEPSLLPAHRLSPACSAWHARQLDTHTDTHTHTDSIHTHNYINTRVFPQACLEWCCTTLLFSLFLWCGVKNAAKPFDEHHSTLLFRGEPCIPLYWNPRVCGVEAGPYHFSARDGHKHLTTGSRQCHYYRVGHFLHCHSLNVSLEDILHNIHIHSLIKCIWHVYVCVCVCVCVCVYMYVWVYDNVSHTCTCTWREPYVHVVYTGTATQVSVYSSLTSGKREWLV